LIKEEGNDRIDFGDGQVAYSILCSSCSSSRLLAVSIFIDIFRSHDLPVGEAAWIIFSSSCRCRILAYSSFAATRCRAHQIQASQAQEDFARHWIAGVLLWPMKSQNS